jgi:hypothetical protein
MVTDTLLAVMIIYFLYMLYFDRMQEEHFGSIRQQVWSFLHFPLHTVLVLVLQGVSLLIIWRQAVESLNTLYSKWNPALFWLMDGSDPDPTTEFGKAMAKVGGNYTNGTAFATYFNRTCYESVYNYIPKGVDASKEIKIVSNAFYDIKMGLDNYLSNPTNDTAYRQVTSGVNTMGAATYKTLFDTFSVTVAKSKNKKTGIIQEVPDLGTAMMDYYRIFDLILSYTFIAVSLQLLYISWVVLISYRVVSRLSLLPRSASYLFLNTSVAQAPSCA